MAREANYEIGWRPPPEVGGAHGDPKPLRFLSPGGIPKLLGVHNWFPGEARPVDEPWITPRAGPPSGATNGEVSVEGLVKVAGSEREHPYPLLGGSELLCPSGRALVGKKQGPDSRTAPGSGPRQSIDSAG